MAFLDRLNEITKPKTFEATYDFGKGDGDETLTFKALSYNDRKRIIFDRMDVIGKDKDGVYCRRGETWVVDHVKGKGDLVKKTRIVTENRDPK